MSSTSPEGSRGAPAVDSTSTTTTTSTGSTASTSLSADTLSSDTSVAGTNGSSTKWSAPSAPASEAPGGSSGSEASPLAGVTAEMRNMARTAAARASSAAQSAAQAARKTPTEATKPVPAAKVKPKGPRRVRLAVARVDPWSIMKLSFLLSVAVGIAGVVLTAVLWMILSTMNVFSDIEGVLQALQNTENPFSIKDYVGFGRVVSLSIVIGVIDVILMTAIATVMAFLYNIASALVGGVQLTLTDD
jgi:hypothetical protein